MSFLGSWLPKERRAIPNGVHDEIRSLSAAAIRAPLLSRSVPTCISETVYVQCFFLIFFTDWPENTLAQPASHQSSAPFQSS